MFIPYRREGKVDLADTPTIAQFRSVAGGHTNGGLFDRVAQSITRGVVRSHAGAAQPRLVPKRLTYQRLGPYGQGSCRAVDLQNNSLWVQ